MEKLGLNEIRKRFLDFFESKDHYVGKSASLIPKNDKSILIINSGMAPLKPYFAGTETPPKKRMCTCQKCIRTGDIDNVGHTARHGTFFEMLGNFSFGDYFKKESIGWGVEFLTQHLGFPMDKLWATVYLDDDEAIRIWEENGMDPSHIVRLGKEDNFWEIGLGPCGPDSEIFYDRGEEFGCGKPDCKPGCDCDRFMEIWNHVFTQFSKEEDGSYSNLAHPNIDTGMGLERMACVMQDTLSIFDVDTIRYILDGVCEMSGVKYTDSDKDSDISIRIITDHIRAMTFMIADGIMPSNEGRGYVLRRILRRAARHGRLLGIEGTFLKELSNRVIAVSGEAYPELVEKKDYIQKIIQVEEDNFNQTLDKGEEIIKEYIEDMVKSGSKILDGDKVFKLYDTYGFPLELTEEILADHGYTADEEGFKVNMQAQKDRARANQKAGDDEGWDSNSFDLEVPRTEFCGYESLKDDGHILAVIKAQSLSESISEGEKGILVLDETPFYAEGGGQVTDKGFMTADGFRAEVLKVEKKDGVFYHTVNVLSGTAAKGDTVTSEVERAKRFKTARNHTATHLLQKALREIVGSHVEQAGSMVNEKNLRFDFSHFEPLTAEQIAAVENRVNEKINEFMPVITKEMPIEEAQKLGAMALFGEKYGSTVRVVNAGDWSIELCGGTHVRNTGEIGCFKILSETGVAAGVRRIEAVTGTGVLEIANINEEVLNQVSEVFKCNCKAVLSKARAHFDEFRSMKKELEEIKKQAMGSEVDEMVKNAKEINGVKLITACFNDYNINDLRTLSDDIKKSYKNTAMVFAAVAGEKVTFLTSLTDDLVEKGYHAGNMIKQIARIAGGGGGGKADMAQAGGKDPSKVNDALAFAETLI
ncbi:MAG: alanine--tRNA ligase [Clostridiales bacterium]|nr:alanine--tRNA ligase [Clostridiales bacterium]